MRLAAAVEGMAVFTGVFVRECLLLLSAIAVWHRGRAMQRANGRSKRSRSDL